MTARSGPITLVVGATGALGGTIARRLLAAGQAVRALVRPARPYEELEREGAMVVAGDLTQPNTLEVACDGVSSVITTATASGRSADDIKRVDIEGTRALIAAASRAPVEQFVFVSVACARADSPVPLARSKAESERSLRQSGLPYTVLQPVAFMESWISFALGAQLLETPGRVQIQIDPDAPLSLIALENVAAFTVAVLRRIEARNRVIPLAPPTRTSFREIVNDIAAVTGHPISIDVVPRGTPISPLPPVMTELWPLLLEQASLSPATLEMTRDFGVVLTGASEFVQRTFAVGA